jgi:hypothetical protein
MKTREVSAPAINIDDIHCQIGVWTTNFFQFNFSLSVALIPFVYLYTFFWLIDILSFFIRHLPFSPLHRLLIIPDLLFHLYIVLVLHEKPHKKSLYKLRLKKKLHHVSFSCILDSFPSLSLSVFLPFCLLKDYLSYVLEYRGLRVHLLLSGSILIRFNRRW